MTIQELTEKLQAIRDRKATGENDREIDHMEADELLLQFVSTRGGERAVEVYRSIEAWYS